LKEFDFVAETLFGGLCDTKNMLNTVFRIQKKSGILAVP
jgi:hypothetical protein